MKKTYDVRIVMTEEKNGDSFTRTVVTYLDGRKWKIPPEVAIHVAREYIDAVLYEKELEYRKAP